MAFGPGSGTIYDPWLQDTPSAKDLHDHPERYPRYTAGAAPKGNTYGEPVRFGGVAPAQGSMGTGSMVAPGQGGTGGGGYGGLGGSYTGSFGGGGGGGGGMGGGYSLPDPTGASAALRDLQMGAVGGLKGLLTRDTAASRKAMEDALYAGQEEGINTAADRARMSMLEGTFARGVGSSSILTELAGRGEQEHADALARARREAFTQAGAEDRADLASELGLNNSAFGAATTGLQGEANVALANLAREQQESQFSRNLGFQGSENAANRAQQASQFGSNLGLSYAQLGQQASQFGQGLAFQGGENAANRSQQQGQFDTGLAFQGSQADANRAQQESMAKMGYDFTGTQNAATRDLQKYLADSGQTFAGGQNQATRDMQKYLAESGQTFTGQQNQLTRDQAQQMMLLQLANSQAIADDNRTAAGIGSAGAGVGALLGPFLAQYLKSLGS
jgi:hypothetical protein